jgi:oligopeptide transport system substrate-binding protein
MRRVLSAILAVIMIAMSMTCLVSCGNEDEGAEITAYLSDRIYGFDPAADYSDDATIAVMHMLYEPLFTLNEKCKVKKAMAKDYSFDKETGDLYITLRESYWSNGDRVTADDFVYAWQRLIDPNTSLDTAVLLYDIKNAWKIKTGQDVVGEVSSPAALGVEAIDIETLHISFEHADVDRDAFLRTLTNIALSPINRESITGQEAYWSNGTASTCFTNGAFSVQALDNAYGYFTLSRNEGYHRPADKNKPIDKYVVPAAIRTLWNIDYDVTDVEHLEALYDEMASKTIFYMGQLSLADRAALKKKATVSDSLSTYSYLFDTTNSLFKTAEVRVILSQVIDRDHIIDMITFGKAATGLVNDSVWNDTSRREKNSFRKVGGNLLGTTLSIDAANTALDVLGARRGSFSITCLDREEDIAIATYVAELWGQLGYTVTVAPASYYRIGIDIVEGEEENGVYYRTSALEYIYEQRLFDVIAMDWKMLYTNAFTDLAGFTTNLNGMGVDMEAYNLGGGDMSQYLRANSTGYASQEFDSLMLAAYNTADLKARAEYLHEAEKVLIGDMPIIPLVFNQSFYVANTRLLKNLDVNYYGFTSFTEAKLKNYKNYFFREEE